jgi:hypothetical protein
MMRRRKEAKEMTVDEFERWSSATDRYDAVADAADEVGGPRLSLVRLPGQNVAWPTDLLPPSGGDSEEPLDSGDPDQPLVSATPFDGIPLESSRKRLAGWSAERQRLFLSVLAETGQVHLASAAARLSARSAQALRVRSAPFNAGWRMAEQMAAGRLSPIAFDRAINGRIEQIYRDGELVAERCVPSDKLLMWLLSRLDPKRFALPWEQRGDSDPQAQAAAAFPSLLDSLGDVPS